MKKFLFTYILSLTSYFLVNAQTDHIDLVVQSGHTDKINKVLVSPDRNWVVSGGNDNRIIVWSRRLQRQYRILSGHHGDVTDLCFTPDNTLYSVSEDSTLRSWNVRSGNQLSKIQFQEELGAITYSSKRNLIALAGTYIHLYDPKSEKQKHIAAFSGGIFNSPSIIEALNFSADGEHLVFADGRKQVGTLSLNTLKVVSLSRKPVKDIVFYKDSSIVVSARYKGVLAKHETNTINTKIAYVAKLGTPIVGTYIIADTAYSITSLGKLVRTDLSRMKNIDDTLLSTRMLSCMSVEPEQGLILIADVRGTISIFDLKSLKLIEKYSATIRQISDVKFSEDGKGLHALFLDGSVRSFSFQNTRQKASRANINKLLSANRDQIRASHFINESDDLSYMAMKMRRSSEFYWVQERIDCYSCEPKSDCEKVEKFSFVNDYFEDIVEYIHHQPPLLINYNNLSDTSANGKLGRSDEKGKVKVYNESGILSTFNLEHNDAVTAIALNDDGSLLLSASWDGLIKLWDVKTGKLLLNMGFFDDEDFALITPSNHYYISKGALQYVGFDYNEKLYAFEQFDLIFNRPDKVFEQLYPIIDSSWVTEYHRAYDKRIEKLGLKEFQIKLSDEVPTVNVQTEQKDDSLLLKIKVESDKSELNKLFISINGVAELGTTGRNISGNTIDFNHVSKLSSGKNLIQVYATDGNGMSSLKFESTIRNKQEDKYSKLYVICLGVSNYEDSSFNLDYATKDANDIAKYFSNAPNFDERIIKIYKDNEVTLEALNEIENTLKGADVDDVVLLFAAGHGLLSSNLDFYFGTHDINFNKPEERGIAYSTFEAILDNSPSRKKCMLIDACHSGEVDKEDIAYQSTEKLEVGEIKFRYAGSNANIRHNSNSFELSKAIFADVRNRSGATVISSAGGGEFALEGNDWKNGVFTYSLLNGLKTEEADLNKDGNIYLSEIHKYVAAKVVELTQGKQQPTSRTENTYNDFKVF